MIRNTAKESFLRISEARETPEMRQVAPEVVDGIHDSLFGLVRPEECRVSAYDAMNAIGADCQTMSDVIALLRVHGRAQFENDAIIFPESQPIPVTLRDLQELDERRGDR